MSDSYINVKRTCEKCSEKVRLYIVCFKCDLTYHPNCWRKLPGAYLNEKGHAFCCWSITSKQDVSDEDLENHVEENIREKIKCEHNNVSESCQLREEDLQKRQKLSKKQDAEYCNDGTNRPINDRPFKCTYKNCVCTAGQEELCKCSMCGYAAAKKGNLNVHILRKHSAKPKKYKCSECNYAAHKESRLNEHIRIHTNDRPFKCTYKNCECTAGQEESCKCSMCGYAAVQKVTLEIHILRKHSAEPKKYKCAVCKYASHLKETLKQHIRSSHTKDRPFKCMYKNCECTAGQEECKCDMCGYAAAKGHNLKMHILTKHSAEPKNYKCADCNYTTHLKQYLDAHIHTHTKDRPFKCMYKNCECPAGQKESCKCDMCGYAARIKCHLKTHILVKHSTEPKKYKCADCKYATHQKEYLKRHIHTHAKDRIFKCMYKNCECSAGQEAACECNMCGYTFTQKGSLKTHILVKHSGKKKEYKCTDCKYATYYKQSLEQHVRTHTDDRPFKCTYKNCKCITGQEESCKCDMCQYKATQKASLKRHILTKHSGKPKKYKCADSK